MKKQKLAKVSPWILAAACTLLFLIIGVFAVSNYQREKTLMTETLLQKGITIIRFVMTSSRASFRGNLRNIHFAMWQWTDHVQEAVDHASEQPDIRFLCLLDSQGKILASSDSSMIGKNVDASTVVFINSLEVGPGTSGKYRIARSNRDEIPSFQVASVYSPFGLHSLIPRLKEHGLDFESSVDRLLGQHPAYQRLKNQLEELRNNRFSLLVELDVSQFNRDVKKQLLQIIFLSLVLLLVGIGGWLSLLTLQGLKGSQSRLAKIRAFTDILISSLPVGLIATDSHGNIRLCNQTAEKIIGLQEKKIVGLPPSQVLPEDLATVFERGDDHSHLPEQKEIYLTSDKQQTRFLLLAGMSVVDNKERLAGNMLLIQDLSHIKKLEEEVRRNEKMAALGKMAAGVAHELRNPLSSIKGLAVLLKSKFQAQSFEHKNAEILVQEVERLNRSIGELLDYARPYKLEKSAINLVEVLQKAMTLISMDADATQVLMSKEIKERHIIVNGDQDKLNQVFLNLLLNSIQAMPKGGKLTVTAKKESFKAVCQIKDTGCGLEQEYTSRVFDPYFTTKSDGTGLGLAMSAKIIDEHGGTIEFISTENVGTVVTVTLPLL